MFHHPAWAVGSYSSGHQPGNSPNLSQPNPGSPPDGSPCSQIWEKDSNSSVPSLTVARRPVVAGAAAVLGEEDVLRVVQFVVLRVHDVVDDARLQVEQDGARDVVLVVGLMKRKRNWG